MSEMKRSINRVSLETAPRLMTQARSVFLACLMLPIAAFGADEDAASQANCDTLVSETRAACTDMISRGLNVSCNTYLGAIKTAMKQAGGDLFDIGEANQETANSFCAVYVEKLSKEREANDGNMHSKDASDSQCRALAERFETNCIANLGKVPLPSQCQNVARTFVMGTTKKMSPKQVCKIASMQLR
ncbi:hypothetical protein [Marinobacter salexigens]|uniref:Secreted protein n=1 Tax=Marinobacter salexigens TaxID=1925763 RepID=A0ABS6A8L3_9GAMM|nr:hypothetical protein [Marinobacter salexigens]MBU2874277.1 hypothetical protein [Marinobacter salexigens]